MLVKSLIERLQRMPENARVVALPECYSETDAYLDFHTVILKTELLAKNDIVAIITDLV